MSVTLSYTVLNSLGVGHLTKTFPDIRAVRKFIADRVADRGDLFRRPDWPIFGEFQLDHKANERRERNNAARREKNAAMRSLGLVRVKGALGGIYWE